MEVSQVKDREEDVYLLLWASSNGNAMMRSRSRGSLGTCCYLTDQSCFAILGH